MNEAVEEEKEEEEEIVSCLCEYTTVIIGRRSSSCGSTFIPDARVYSCVGGGRAGWRAAQGSFTQQANRM